MDHLTTEARNPASTRLDELSPVELALLMNREDSAAVEAVGARADAIARGIELIAERLANGGRLIYVGAGTSGRLGVLDATECPPTFNTPPELVVGLIAGGPTALTRAVEGAEDHPEYGEQDLRAVSFSAKDVLVGIATSGRTPYVLGAAKYAKSLGAPVIGLSCNADSDLEPLVDLMICPVVGPEVLSGSTRLKAGTATKLVLNTLTTGAMVRLGKTYGNLMVDLHATNTKLKARTNRIVRMVTGADETTAAQVLAKADGELKTALIMQAAGLDAPAARAALAAHHGKVGATLAQWRQARTQERDDALVIGIDGGGTNTMAILADGENILGRGQSGPGNLQSVGIHRAFAAMDEAIGKAFAAANRPRAMAGAICFGLAGADRSQEKKLVREWAMRQRLAEWIETTNDGALLLAAGTPEGWGIGLVAGTGSIAVARTADGQVARSGGWGYLLGDEGSGYALAMHALNVICRSADGRGGQSPLTERILDAMGLTRPFELIPAIYRGSWDRSAIAGLAPTVLQVAAEGDDIAQTIVAGQARELANIVAAAARQLKLSTFPLALTGGTLLGSDSYREQLLAALNDAGLTGYPVSLVAEPALGAVRIARKRKALTV